MEDIRSVLSQFHTKKKTSDSKVEKAQVGPGSNPTISEIPDVFFDLVLQKFKLNRQEIALLMYLYRQVWCRANLYKAHGIGPLNSYADLALLLGVTVDEIVHHIHSLENYGFIETVRSGQYFVRKYFLEELDRQFGQTYNDFF